MKEVMCDLCGIREAAVFIKRSVNGEQTESRLCAKCAQMVTKGGALGATLLGGGISELLGLNVDTAPAKVRVCKCGATQRDIEESYLFGCSECYNTFRDLADKYVKKLGGSVYHGKAPTRVEARGTDAAKPKSRLVLLEEQLQKALEEEDYYKAAELKEKISVIKDGGKNE